VLLEPVAADVSALDHVRQMIYYGYFAPVGGTGVDVPMALRAIDAAIRIDYGADSPRLPAVSAPG
jgi:hypothetical protein